MGDLHTMIIHNICQVVRGVSVRLDKNWVGEAHIIRLKVDEYPMFNDLVYGKSGQNRLNNSKLPLP
jgi:hypothetical protein